VRPGENSNHPKKGSSIKVEPIRKLRDIRSIKTLLSDSPRNYALFVLGINWGLRASDLLSIEVGQVKDLKVGQDFEVRERKTGKRRRITVNKAAHEAIQRLLGSKPFADEAPLFQTQWTAEALTVPSLNALVKKWTRMINLQGNYGTHTLRKTFGYIRRTVHGASLPQLMECFNHRTQKETLNYLCVQKEEIKSIYMADI
jgi:integrase